MSSERRCSLPECTRPAASTFRLIPRRVDAPCCDLIRRALVWPCCELACTVAACAPHRADVRQAAQVVISETVLSDDVVTRTVSE